MWATVWVCQTCSRVTPNSQLSDGTTIAFGENRFGCCNIPAMTDGVAYTHVAAIGICHTVLLTSDGNAVACGQNHRGQCSIPALPPGVTYVYRGAQMVLAFTFCESHAAFCLLSGKEVCRVKIHDSDRLINIRKVFQSKMKADHGIFRIVMPGGRFLNAICVQDPSITIEQFLVWWRRRSGN